MVADTHCPEFIPRLPAGVFEALSGVDLILHAGDVNGRTTLDDLGRLAPVRAARGDHDSALPELAPVLELEVDGRRVVVVHGNRSRWVEEPQTFLWTITLGFYAPHRRLPALLARRFPDADVIVYGHTHRAQVFRTGGKLVFNPGGVYQWTRETTRVRLQQHPGWFEWCWLQVARHIRRTPPQTVGVLTFEPDGVKAEIVPI